MMGEVEHVELKVRDFKQAQYWKWHICEYYNDIIQQQKVGYTLILAVVDPIITHILCENQEFLHPS